MSPAPPTIDVDDLQTSIDSEESARLAVSLTLQRLRDDEAKVDADRDSFGDALAVAARFLSFGDLHRLTGLDKAYLHRLAKKSALYQPDQQ